MNGWMDKLVCRSCCFRGWSLVPDGELLGDTAWRLGVSSSLIAGNVGVQDINYTVVYGRWSASVPGRF